MNDNLSLSRLQLFQRLYEQVTSSVDRAIRFYQTEADRLKLDHANRKWHEGSPSAVDYYGVEIKWDEYYKSCHFAGGRFDIAWAALADDSYKQYITELVKQHVLLQDTEYEAKKARSLQYKMLELAKLKAELGEA